MRILADRRDRIVADLIRRCREAVDGPDPARVFDRELREADVLRAGDEALHFAAAFTVAGFRDVVGTLWSVGDRTAVRLAEGFYTRLAGGGRDPARALHAAVQELRAAYPHLPAVWAAYVHSGP